MKKDRASSTAFSVSQGLLYTARRDDIGEIVPPDLVAATERIMQTNPEGRQRLAALDSAVYGIVTPFAERLVAPGLRVHYVMRKRYIADAVEAAIADGATQVVNLGAGFDALALRLHERHPGVTFIELDHPATCREKRASFEQIQAQYDHDLSEIHLLPIDFTHQTLAARLREFEPFDAARRTAFVCEGVLMYLDAEAVTQLFADVKAVAAPKSRFVFTALEPMDSPDHAPSLLLRVYLKLKSEALRWRIGRHDLPGFAEAQGYRLLNLGTAPVFADRYLGAHAGTVSLHTTEYVAVAEVAP